MATLKANGSELLRISREHGYVQGAILKQFNKAIEARRAARAHAAKPGAVRVIPDKRFKAPKHKKREEDTND